MGAAVRHRRLIQAALDIAAALVVVAIFAGTGDPDDLFHVVWVILTIQAFLFGLRGSLARIAAAAGAVVAYWLTSGPGTARPIELTSNLLVSEWPLMLAIILLVAVMAERVGTTGARYAALYRRASARLITAQEVERRRLALDLHDGVGQTITAVTLTLHAARDLLASGASPASPALDALLAQANEAAGLALDETRHVASRLRPPRLRERGLAAAIRDLARGAGAPVEVTVRPGADRVGLLDPAAEIEAFRVVQEAVANAVRHAAATRVWIVLEVARGALEVEVGDDGRGFDRRRAGDAGLGIPGMIERAQTANGTISITSRPGAGTRVRLSIPVAAGTVAATMPGPRHGTPARPAAPPAPAFPAGSHPAIEPASSPGAEGSAA